MKEKLGLTVGKRPMTTARKQMKGRVLFGEAGEGRLFFFGGGVSNQIV